MVKRGHAKSVDPAQAGRYRSVGEAFGCFRVVACASRRYGPIHPGRGTNLDTWTEGVALLLQQQLDTSKNGPGALKGAGILFCLFTLCQHWRSTGSRSS